MQQMIRPAEAVVDRGMRLVYADDVFMQLIAAAAHSSAGRSLDELAPELNALVRQVLLSGEPVRNHVLVCNGNTLFVTVEPVYGRHGVVLGAEISMGTAEDRSLPTQNRRPHEYAALLEVLLQSAPVGFAVQDRQTRYLLINEWLAALNGRSIADHIGRSVYEVVPLVAERNAMLIQRVLATGQPLEQVEFAGIVPAPGWGERICEVSYYPVRKIDGAVVAVGMVVVDVTEYRHAIAEQAAALEREQTARQAAELAAIRIARLQAVTATLSEALTPTDVIEVMVTTGINALDAAAGGVALLADDGVTLEVPLMRGFPPAVESAFRSFPLDAPLPLADAVRTATPIWLENCVELEARYPQLSAASLHWSAWAALPLQVHGRILGGLSLCFYNERSFDADERALALNLAQQCAQALERARLYVAAQEAHAQAETALRMRDIFFSVAAHELRTPLTALLGQAQLLERRARNNSAFSERDQRTIGVIGGQAGRLNKMIAALLDIARIESGQLALERSLFNLGALITSVAEEIRPTLFDHELIYELSNDPLLISGDALRLEQVLQNLIGNAVKYSPAGGTVTIRAFRSGTVAHIKVIDQGIGIPESALPHLFQRFYRAANSDARQISGMGIGLYVVREIVQLHGGEVHATGVEGQGSTFTVILPLEPVHYP